MTIGLQEKPAQLLPRSSVPVVFSHDAGRISMPHVLFHRALQLLENVSHGNASAPQDPLSPGRSTSVHLCAPVTNVTVHNGLLALERPGACFQFDGARVSFVCVAQMSHGRRERHTSCFDALFPGLSHLDFQCGLKLFSRIPPGIFVEQTLPHILDRVVDALYLCPRLKAQLLARRIRHVGLHALVCFIAQLVYDLCRLDFEGFEGGWKESCECIATLVVDLVDKWLCKLFWEESVKSASLIT